MTNKRIVKIVQSLLIKNSINNPPIPIETIAQKEGLSIKYQPLESTLSGFLYQTDKERIIGVNSNHSEVRQRFTIAHELGHFLLQPKHELHIDRDVYVNLRGKLSSQGTNKDEISANSFAAEMLMPQAFIENDFVDMTIDILDDDFPKLTKLVKKYKVSAQALFHRLHNLANVENH